MADDLDQLIRAAMKTLDEQVPSGYFEALPNQTIARLEGSMQHGSSGTTDTRNQVAPPPATALEVETAPAAPHAGQHLAEERDDSGLHDIRNLAQSTKQRLSSRRSTQNPIISDDDVLASSSGSFKNIALPQPARMVSLPEIEDLPSKAEVAIEKASKKAAKEAKAELAAAAVAAPAAEAPAAPSPAARQAFSLPSQQNKKSKAPLLAILGTGLAAAAGYVVFLQVNKADKAEPAAVTAASEQTAAAPSVAPAAAAPVVEPLPAPPPAEAPVEPAKLDEAAAAAPVAQIAADEGADKNADTKVRKSAKKGKKADDAEKDVVEQKAPEKVDAKKPAPAAKGGGEESGEPSFDALLKEAGVAEKKEAKPVLEKKSLTSDDFKKGIGAVTPKAKGCYNGTQGTAMVKLTVAPSGQVSKVLVAGEFAGKPEASCVESALKAATFPPWDGGPQSFTYSVLLSD